VSKRLPIPGFGGYEIDTLGQVWSELGKRGPGNLKNGSVTIRTGTFRKLTPAPTSSGYLGVILRRDDGARKSKLVHSLVLEVFVGPRLAGMQACHNDGNKLNNRLDNLRWDTPSSNQRDRVRHGTHGIGEANPRAILTNADVVAIRARLIAGEGPKAIAMDYGVSAVSVSHINRGISWKNTESGYCGPISQPRRRRPSMTPEKKREIAADAVFMDVKSVAERHGVSIWSVYRARGAS
jgi:hypothetical protein